MKTVKVLVAALAAVAIAVPAMAVTADISGNFWARGIMTDGAAGDDVTTKGIDQRLRLFTTAAANENVKMVFGIEVDNVWGRVKQETTQTELLDANGDPTGVFLPSAPGKEVGAMGADAKAEIEIKHLYLDFKTTGLNAKVRAGVQGFNLGRGMIINDDAAGLQFSMPVAGNDLAFMYIRTQQGSDRSTRDDGNFYAAKFSLAMGGMKLAPYLGYYKEQGALGDGDVIYVGADLDGKAGNFGYAATAIWNKWDAGNADGNGLALYGKVSTKIDRLGLSLEAGYMGDDDAGDFVSLQQNAATGPLVNISELSTGGRYPANSAITTNIGGAANLYRTNWLFAKIGADLQLTQALKGSLFIAHIEEAEGLGRTYGQEVNAYLDYAIVPNLDLNLMGAYLMADSDIRNDDVWKLGTMLAYRF